MIVRLLWGLRGGQRLRRAAVRVDDPAHAVLSPRRLGHLVSDLLSQGRPAELLELDPL